MKPVIRLVLSLLVVAGAAQFSAVWAQGQSGDHPNPPGNAFGLRRNTPISVASAGIARGDFNGDGIGDLAVGSPREDVGTIDAAGSVTIIFGSASEGLSADTAATVLPAQLWTQNTSGVLDSAEANDEFGSSLAAGDFNNDEFSDLAIGAPEESISSTFFTGSVNVLYGSAAGLTATGDQLFTMASAALPTETRSNFGEALVWGDFNADGFGDLAVGAPGASVGTASDVGLAVVFFGSASGLTTAGRQLLHQTVAGTPNGENLVGTAEGGEDFARSLTAGDFDGNGASDLAIGVPLQDSSATIFNSGIVHVIYGSPTGLFVPGAQVWSQNTPTVPDASEATDQFGSGLGAGDFNGDGRDDLVVAVPLETVGTESDAGAVNVFYGTGLGLSATNAQFWHQDTTGVLDTAESSDFFGSAVAANDFNADGFDDLAVGAYLEEIGTEFAAGSVNVIYGSATRLSATAGPGNQFWHQDVTGVNDQVEELDYFGFALTAWNFGRTANADLAIGVPRENVLQGGVDRVDAGAVSVLYGSGAGLASTADQLWTQDSGGIPDTVEAGDQFGTTIY